MPSSFMRASPMISTSMPMAESVRMSAAIVSGYFTLPGSETRSREKNTPSAILSSG